MPIERLRRSRSRPRRPVPDPPTGLITSAGVSGGQILVVFTPPVNTGGSPITGYTVTANPAGGVDTNAGSVTTAHTITGLTNGTAYTFTATAKNINGTSASSVPSSSVTPSTVPGAPTAVTATAGNAQATVNFTAPAFNGGLAITGYAVTSSPAGGVDSNAGTTGTSHVVTGLVNGAAYTFTVRATNSSGTSVPSAPSASVIPSAGVVAVKSALEIPGPGSYNSGIGQISGWSCQGPVSVVIDGTKTLAMSYGSGRGDTASVCGGKTDNGFILLTNYNIAGVFGAGSHTAQVMIDGVPSGAPTQFNVTVPVGEFLTGVGAAGCTVQDFPSAGKTTSLVWQQGMQNFAISSAITVPPITARPDTTSNLEIPGPNSFNSGVGQISGWSCAGPVTVSIDGAAPLATSYGSGRGDTAGACGGKTANGFILLTNYNILGAGAHTAQVLVNGVPRGTPTAFAVTVPGGVEFLSGASGGCTVPFFPNGASRTTLVWQQGMQNFAIKSVGQ